MTIFVVLIGIAFMQEIYVNKRYEYFANSLEFKFSIMLFKAIDHKHTMMFCESLTFF